MCKGKLKNKLARVLKRGNGKLILISGTEHPYYVQQALKNGLSVYCNQRNVYLGHLEPTLRAKNDPEDIWWESEVADLGVCELVRMLDSYSPKGFYFHRPIFGLVLEWGWFRQFYFRNKRKEEI